MIFAAAYMIIYFANQSGGAVTIPYKSMEQCQEQALKLNTNDDLKGHGYCIEGSK